MSDKNMAVARQITMPQGPWPMDENGKPMAYVAIQVSELVGLPQYSNVTVGPAMAAGFCTDTTSDRRTKLHELAQDVEFVLGQERQKIIDMIGR